MALTKEDLQAIQQLLQPLQDDIAGLKQGQAKLEQGQKAIKEQQIIHTASITTLENTVMHELKLLNEHLPDVLARREAFEDMADKVGDHGNRIFALEQKVSNE